jgi:predicted MFS family arabinose efflux permease
MAASPALRVVWQPLALSTVAQLPLAAVGIGLLVHVQRLTGSYAAAGVASGLFAAASGIAAPSLGRVADRRGRRRTLSASAAVSSCALALVAVAPTSLPIGVLYLLTAVAGGATPPIAACMRSMLPEIVDAGVVRSVFAIESSALELTFISGPPLALAIGSAWSPRVALAACAIVLLLATLGFARTRLLDAAPARTDRRSCSAMGSAAIRTLVAVLACVGVIFGAVEVAVTATAAERAGTAAAAPLLAVWGVGSLLGGIVTTRVGGGARSSRGLSMLVAALTLTHVALATGADSLLATGILLVPAGATIAPTYATVYALAGAAAPRGTATETFAWLGTAVAAGAAAGAAAAGVLVDRAGPEAVLLLAGLAGCAGFALTLVRAHTLSFLSLRRQP